MTSCPLNNPLLQLKVLPSARLAASCKLQEPVPLPANAIWTGCRWHLLQMLTNFTGGAIMRLQDEARPETHDSRLTTQDSHIVLQMVLCALRLDRHVYKRSMQYANGVSMPAAHTGGNR